MDQEQYDEDIKVVILPDRQEVTSEDLTSMPDVVRERVRAYLFSGKRKFINLIMVPVCKIAVLALCNILHSKEACCKYR